MFLYCGFFSSSFMNLIQMFWFGEVGRADTIAMSPLLWISWAAHWTSSAPISLFEEGATKIVRESGATSPSYETTLTPFARARLSAGATAFGSEVEITI